MTAKKEIPVLYNSKDECCECGACYAICPVQAISMCADDEGFLYPNIDENICVRCFRCLAVCAFKG